MINHEDYDCKEQGECYLTYRKRMKREQQDFEHRRTIKQTNQEWINELSTYANFYRSGLRRNASETLAEFRQRAESRQAPGMGKNERG